MNARDWPRVMLGLTVAAVVPIAIGGGCGGKSEESEGDGPARSGAGAMPSSGAPSGGAAAGGAAAGNSTGGRAGGDAGGRASGGQASIGGAGSCCENSRIQSQCTADGQAVMTCATLMGAGCQTTSVYSYVWRLQACSNGCVGTPSDAGNGGQTSQPHCL